MLTISSKIRPLSLIVQMPVMGRAITAVIIYDKRSCQILYLAAREKMRTLQGF